VTWARDDAKLERVRALMADVEFDALVVRAPDNVLYLTNFWGMKGFDAAVFPREGEPILITIEPSAQDAADTAWTSDVRLVPGYDAADPRPPARPPPSSGESGSSSASGRRRPTGWWASRRPTRRHGSTPFRTPATRRRS
jgi:Xaa-Pro aminopeptidase